MTDPTTGSTTTESPWRAWSVGGKKDLNARIRQRVEVATAPAASNTPEHRRVERLAYHQECELGRGQLRILDHEFSAFGQPDKGAR